MAMTQKTLHRLENALLAVARAANELEVLSSTGDGSVAIESEGWKVLDDALAEWRKASADMMAETAADTQPAASFCREVSTLGVQCQKENGHETAEDPGSLWHEHLDATTGGLFRWKRHAPIASGHHVGKDG